MIVQDTMQYLSQLDPEVGASVQEEIARQQRNIELNASENIDSPPLKAALGTSLTSGPVSCSAVSTPMCSPTPAPMPIWRLSSPWPSRETPF